VLALVAFAPQPTVAQQTFSHVTATVCFVPGEDCTGLIVETIGRARKEILLQAYYFTAAPIAKALVDAVGRGVTVRAILDKSQRTGRYSGADFLAASNIPVVIDDRVAIAHNKVVIIDRAIVIGGSFNYTASAQQRNAENVTILESAPVAAAFAVNWQSRYVVSVPYISERRP